MVALIILAIAIIVVAAKFTIGFWVVISIIAVWTLFSWEKIPYEWNAIYVLLGRRIEKPILKEGWTIVPLKGILRIEKVDGTKQNFKIEPTDIWTKPIPSLSAGVTDDAQLGEVQLGVVVNLEYSVTNPFTFLSIGGLHEIEELLTSLSQATLRKNFREYDENAALAANTHDEIMDKLKKTLRAKAGDWGLTIHEAFLSKVNRDDEDVRKDVQLYRREMAQQRGELVQTETVIKQAKKNLEARGILETNPAFGDLLAAEIEKIRQWRIQELSAEKGKAVVVPFPTDFFKKGDKT